MSNFGTEMHVRGMDRAPEPRGVQFRNSVDIGGFFAILRRRLLWIIVGLVVAFIAAFFYIMFAPLAYTSTISILIDARDRQPVGSDQAPLPQTADPIMVESQLKLMTSDAVLRRVVSNEHLESDPEFASVARSGLLSSLTSILDRGAVSAPAMDRITDDLFQRISVKRPDRTYVVDMDVKASTPGKASRLANAIAKAFIDVEREAGDAYTQEQSEWVVQRTGELRAKVELAERRVQDYKARNGIVDIGGTLTQEQQLQEANRDLVAARAKSGEAQARVDQIRRIIASGKALDGTYDTINSTVIRQLRVQYSDLIRRQAAASQKYGDKHPEYLDIQQQLEAVRGQINDEMQRISSALNNEALVAKGNEQAAQKRVQILEANTTDTNQTSLQLRELQRQADGERTNYEKFLRANDSIRRDLTQTPYARIVAPASFPLKPSSPKVVAALLIAISGGLSLGVGLAVAIDYGRSSAPVATRFAAEPRFQEQRPDYPEDGPDDGPTGGRHTQGKQEFGPNAFNATPVPDLSPSGRYPEPGQFEETGQDWAVTTNHHPVVIEDERPPVKEPEPVYWDEPTALEEQVALPEQSQDEPDAREPFEPQMAAPPTSSASVDPRDLLSRLLADLENGQHHRLLLTAKNASSQKTELTMALAKATAARGHVVLIIDGDNHSQSISRQAVREGLPARLQLDGIDIGVLGIPSIGDGVVFVLPHDAVAADVRAQEGSFIDCRIAAVMIDGPTDEQDLAQFARLTDTGFVVDPYGYLHEMNMGQADEAEISTDTSSRRSA